jgi:hypothetical protein
MFVDQPLAAKREGRRDAYRKRGLVRRQLAQSGLRLTKWITADLPELLGGDVANRSVFVVERLAKRFPRSVTKRAERSHRSQADHAVRIIEQGGIVIDRATGDKLRSVTQRRSNSGKDQERDCEIRSEHE